MAADPPSPAGVHPDGRAWARTHRVWGQQGAPWLHTEVARRMAERLPLIRQAPGVILEWDAGGSGSRQALAQACPQAELQPVGSLPSVELAPAGAAPAMPVPSAAPIQAASPGHWWHRLLGIVRRSSATSSGSARPPVTPPPARIKPAIQPEEVAAQAADLVWSNMGLHTHPQAAGVLSQWHQALAVDGFLMFSTFGPDTLRELSALWGRLGWGPAAQPFVDMHDWGDALVHAGFADPVMDQETIRLTWASPEAALAELRTLGRNAHPGRYGGCRTPRWRARMMEALAGLAGPDGRLSLSFEIIYGHAFRPAPRPDAGGTTTISLQDMRAMVQTTRQRH